MRENRVRTRDPELLSDYRVRAFAIGSRRPISKIAMTYKKTAIIGCSVLALLAASPSATLFAQDDAEAARKGVELAKKKDYSGAAEEFGKAIKANPKAARHYSNRGKAYRAAGKLDEAESDFGKVIELEPKNADAFSERGKVRVSQKKYDEAIDDLSKAIDLDDDDVDSVRFRGFAHLSKQDWDKAIEDYSEVLEKKPKDVEALRRRGFAYVSNGDKEKAKEDFEAILKAKPNDEDATERLKVLEGKKAAAPGGSPSTAGAPPAGR